MENLQELANKQSELLGTEAPTVNTPEQDAVVAPEPAAEASVEAPLQKEDAGVKDASSVEEAPVVDEPTEEKKEEPPKWELNFEEFNKTLETDYKSTEEIKQAFEKSKSTTNYEAKLKEVEELHAKEVEELRKRDAVELFGKEGYQELMIRQKLGDGKNLVVLKGILDGSIEKKNPIDKAAARLMFDDNSLNASTAVAMVLESAGVRLEDDGTLEEGFKFNDIQNARIRRQALEADEYFKGIKETDIPSLEGYDDIKKEREAKEQERVDSLNKAWGPKLDDTLRQFEKYDGLPEEEKKKYTELQDFSYEVDQASKELLRGRALEFITKKNLELNEANLKLVAKELYGAFEVANYRKIYSAAMEHLKSKLIEKHDSDVHNPQPISKEEAPDAVVEDLAKSQKESLSSIGIGRKSVLDIG
jgi:hypothetical protein